MTLGSPHKDWKLDSLLVTEARFIGLDEMMTQLWLRVAYDNQLTSARTSPYSTIAQLASLMEDSHSAFVGFRSGSGVAESWIRSDLVKVLKRSPGEFAVARPVHLPATRLRNTKKDKDSNASAIPHLWLSEDRHLVDHLKSFIEVSQNPSVDELGDLPSFALARLAENEGDEVPTKARGEAPAPLCPTQGVFYREDVACMLAYESSFPRAVLVDHLRRLTALHVYVHLLRTYAYVVELAADPEFHCGCSASTHDECRVQPDVFADCGDEASTRSARLAEQSWASTEQVVARYVRAHLLLRKLYEFGKSDKNKRTMDGNDLRSIARLRTTATRSALDQWSDVKLETLPSGADRDRFRDLRAEYEDLVDDKFDVYMAILYADGERRWYSYHRQILDSLLAKNARDGVMLQPLGGRRLRRLVVSPVMLETLALVAMVRLDHGRAVTRPIRVDQLVDRLALRYGLRIASPPRDLEDDPGATRAAIENHATLRARLRQAGLYVDLSDAFLAQTIRPRLEVVS